MAITVLQVAQSGSIDGITVTFPSPITRGNSLIVGVAYVENGARLTSITDTLLTTYAQKKIRIGSGTQGSAEAWLGIAPTDGVNTLTLHFTSGKSARIFAVEVEAGVGFKLIADQTSDAQHLGVQAHDFGSITTTQPDAFLFGMAYCLGSFALASLTTGYTRRGTSPLTALCLTRTATAIETTTGAYTTVDPETMTGVFVSFILADADLPSPGRVTQLTRSLVVRPGASPLRATQLARTAVVTQTHLHRITQVVRTFIVRPGVVTPPDVVEPCVTAPPVAGCWDETPLPPTAAGTPPTEPPRAGTWGENNADVGRIGLIDEDESP